MSWCVHDDPSGERVNTYTTPASDSTSSFPCAPINAESPYNETETPKYPPISERGARSFVSCCVHVKLEIEVRVKAYTDPAAYFSPSSCKYAPIKAVFSNRETHEPKKSPAFASEAYNFALACVHFSSDDRAKT